MSTELVQSKDALEAESRSWAARAQGLQIVNVESCRNASLLLRSVKTLRHQVQQWFAPHIDAAMETKRKAEAMRKGLADERDRIEAPLVDAEAILKRNLLAYETAQERLRLAEEHRLQEEARQHAETVTLEAAAALETEAVRTGDVAMLQEAEDILTQPIEAPAVSVAKMVPKVQGVTYRDNWKAHPSIDVKALAAAVTDGRVPVTFLVPDMAAINAFARATKGMHEVPGVRFFNDRQVAARG